MLKTRTNLMCVLADLSHTGKGQHIGYWATSLSNDPQMYMPWPGDFIDNTWDAEEKEKLAKYLDEQPDVQHWRGLSYCRLCSRTIEGTTDKSNGTYVWPAGFSHYLREHNVKPPQEFIDNCLVGIPVELDEHCSKFRIPAIYALPDWVKIGTRIKPVAGHPHAVTEEAIVHSFVDENINIKIVSSGAFYHYLRLDFTSCFEQAE